MRIGSSDVSLRASQINVKTSSTYASLRQWNAQSDTTTKENKSNGEVTFQSIVKKDSATISNAQQSSIFSKTPTASAVSKDPLQEILDEFSGDTRLMIIKEIIEMFTGKKIEVLDTRNVGNSSSQSPVALDQQNSGENSSSLKRAGWGVDFYSKETSYTKEGVAFSASGAVKTADGKAIEFKVSMEMSRESLNEQVISLKAGDALIDPLMIDVSGRGVHFSDAKFQFDLDANGTSELINSPGKGCGFLAYDKNGNGVIDNGTELFGPASGSGFSELSQLDDDKNGWIDENDSAYQNLSIWQKTPDGSDMISSLKAMDIGAIYTGSVGTRFNITGNENSPNGPVTGVLRDTGFILKDSGGTGFIQQVDMVV